MDLPLHAVASIIGVAGLHHWARAQQLGSCARGRAVCIGMGGGSVPLFLWHHFPQLQVRELMHLPRENLQCCLVK
jgi:hypothetical protein